MEKILFALSLGFAGVILATQAGFSAPQPAITPAAPSYTSLIDTSSSAHVTS
jgi:hypothetical protein